MDLSLRITVGHRLSIAALHLAHLKITGRMSLLVVLEDQEVPDLDIGALLRRMKEVMHQVKEGCHRLQGSLEGRRLRSALCGHTLG